MKWKCAAVGAAGGASRGTVTSIDKDRSKHEEVMSTLDWIGHIVFVCVVAEVSEGALLGL